MAMLSASAAPAVTRIVASCVNADACTITGSLIVHLPGEQSTLKVPLFNGEARLEAPIPAESQLELEAPGFWMPSQPAAAAGNGSGAFRVWRTTLLRGRFVTQPPAKEVPKSFTVGVESAPEAKGERIGRGTSIVCPVAADGSWACAVPAATLDLVLRARTYTPHYLWEQKLTVGTPLQLGNVTLRREASLVAWLDSKFAKSLRDPARARLVRMAMSSSPTLGDRLTVPVAEGVFSRRGAVQLAPVPPGTYTLEVSAPGFATARVDRLQVYEHSESVLRAPIRLDPPIILRISVDPPRDPEGGPWSVAISRLSELSFHAMPVTPEAPLRDGLLVLPGQSPGRFRVRVSDAQGNDFAFRELEIHDQIDASRTVTIPVLQLEGKLTSGKEGIPGTLTFGGRSGAERIRVTADRDGSFHVTLPRPGRWLIDVEEEASGVRAAVTTTVNASQETLRVELPATEVKGWVTGADGKRLGGARVMVITAGTMLTAASDADGSFRFRGLAQGQAQLSAIDRRTGESSRTADVRVEEGTATPEIVLAIRSSRGLKGVVTSEGQPLIGARVVAYALDEVGGVPRAVTGLDGGFELALSPSARSFSLLVAAPGRTLQAFLSPPTDTPLTLDVAAAGGLLRLHLPPTAKRPVVFYNGALMPINDLVEWAHAHGPLSSTGDVLDVPDVAPGAYRLCVTGERGEVCRDGVLARGGTLTLDAQ